MFRKFILFSLILVLYSCGKDVIVIEEPNNPSESDIQVEVDLLGFTTDKERVYIPDGNLVIDGIEINSNESGFFHLEKVLIGKKGKIVGLKKAGYLPSYTRMINHQNLEEVILNLQMIQAPESISIGAAGGKIESENGLLNISKSVVNESTDFIFQTFIGKQANRGNADPLYFGIETEYLMKEASVYVMGSKPINQDAQMEVQLETDSFFSTDINDLFVFQFDNSSLSWKKRDIELVLSGNEISFLIGEYGWWTIARSLPAQYSTLNLTQSGGLPISRAESQISFGENGQNETINYTSSQGSISTYFPEEKSINISFNNGEYIGSFQSGFSESKDSEIIEFEEDVQLTFEGSVYSCDFSSTNGFAAIISDGQHKIKVIKNGYFDGELFQNSEDVIIQFYSEDYMFLSDKKSSVAELQSDINNFFSCADLNDNLIVLNGSSLFQDFDVCRVKVRPKETVVIGERGNGDIFLVSYSGEKEGLYDGLIYFPLITDEDVKAEVKVNIILYDEIENKLGGFIKTEYISTGEDLTISFIGNIE